jgi:hypothetical protein
MKTMEALEKKIVEITATIEKLKMKKFDDLNDADKRNLERNCAELKWELEIAERDLELIK